MYEYYWDFDRIFWEVMKRKKYTDYKKLLFSEDFKIVKTKIEKEFGKEALEHPEWKEWYADMIK